ncbi:MAG: complex I NDUFA9 subunit family protein [Pseudomonadota bacterium]
MRHQRICILGGSGFVGRRLSAALLAEGRRVRVLTRSSSLAHTAFDHPDAEVVQVNPHYVSDLSERLSDCDAVINLVGILNESGDQTFRLVHGELPAKVAEACRYCRIERLLHMSALGVSDEAPSAYLRSKAIGEQAAMTTSAAVTRFRPSVIFGRDDDFTNRFATLIKWIPFVFPLAAPNATLTPVFIDDVVSAFVGALDDPTTFGERYDLVGPTTYTLAEVVRLIASVQGRRRFVLGLNPTLSDLQARVMEWVPGKPLTRDNLASLSVPGESDSNALPRFNINPTPMESILPTYLSTTATASTSPEGAE